MNKVKILELIPTQIAVGFQQVNEKSKKLEKKTKDEIKDYLMSHKVPLIKYKDNLYIIDHHHLCCALDSIDKKSVFYEIKEDCSDLSESDFWSHMIDKKYIWLYDHNGVHISLEKFLEILPKNIKELKDDPYRSLSGILRKKNYYKKDWTPFSEFTWANLFRKHIVLKNSNPSEDEIMKAILLINKFKK